MIDEPNTVESLVRRILESDEKARNSDNYLFYKVCNHFLRPQGINVRNITFKELFLNLKKYGIPQFETVGRCRRKLQEKDPSLCASPEVTEQRTINEENFRDYAKG